MSHERIPNGTKVLYRNKGMDRWVAGVVVNSMWYDGPIYTVADERWPAEHDVKVFVEFGDEIKVGT